MDGLSLSLLPEVFAIYRFPPTATIPSWAVGSPFCNFTRTKEELSVVCPIENEPEDLPSYVKAARDWRMLKVAGPLDFSLVGVLASLAQPLAEGGIPIFVISTFDTDYLLIKVRNLESASLVLQSAGHKITNLPRII